MTITESLPMIPAHDVADRHGHTERDFAELTAAGIDPATTQPRDHAVRCLCGQATFNQQAGCDRDECYLLPGAAQRALADRIDLLAEDALIALAREEKSSDRRPSVRAHEDARNARIDEARRRCDELGLTWDVRDGATS